MTALLEVEGLSVSFRRPGRVADLLTGARRQTIDILIGVSLHLDAGETLGLVGESGSGKTTLIRSLIGLAPRSGGNVRYRGKPLATATEFAAIRTNIAMMFQDPVASLSPRLTVGALLAEPGRIHGLAGERPPAVVDRLLGLVGLSPTFASRYPHELSGGQARRIGVARALALDPALILADEPTAGLDVSVQGDILNLLRRLQRERGLAFVIVTHNLAVVRHVAHRLAVLYLGRIVETGPTKAIFAAPRHPYTHSLIEAEPKPDPRRRRQQLAITGEVPSLLRRPSGCEFHTRCAIARERCRGEAPALIDAGGGRSVRCHFPL